MNINLAFKYILVAACVIAILFGFKMAFNAAMQDTMNRINTSQSTTP